MLYAVVSAFCLLKMGKTQDCLEALADFKSQKPKDTPSAKYLVEIYNGLGRHSEATAILEHTLSMFKENKQL